MVNHVVHDFTQNLTRTYANATRSTELIVRWGIALGVVFTIMLPTMLVMLRWINEVLGYPAEKAGEFPWLDYGFGGMVIALVFFFGIGLLFALADGAPELEIIIIAVSVGMTLMGFWLENQVTYNCMVEDMSCEARLYYAVLGMVSVITFLAFLLLLALRHPAPWLAVLFLAQAWFQSDVLLFRAWERPAMAPNDNTMRAVLLMFFSLFWVMLFLRSQGWKKKR